MEQGNRLVSPDICRLENGKIASGVVRNVDFTKAFFMFKISDGFMEHAQACKEYTTASAPIFMKSINVQDGHVQISSTSFNQI